MSTRELWMIGAIGLLVVILIGVGIAVAVGGGDDNKIVATASTLPTATTSLAVTTTTAAPTSVTVGIICTTPADASQSVVNAWEAGDKAAAARCANQAALKQLFKASGSGVNWMFQGCGGPDPSAPKCHFSYAGGTANLMMTGTDATGWKVDTVTYLAG